MTPQSIDKTYYSEKLDAYMFGVNVRKVASKQSYTPFLDDNTPRKLSKLMKNCWKHDPSDRSSF